jgi:hypothetical protein
VYNGFVTNFGQQINQQPLYTQDFANDKDGITVNNKGEVKTYTNMRINEMRHDGMNTGLFSDEEEEYSYVSPKKHFDGLDQIGDGKNDLEYGTMDDDFYEDNQDEIEYYLDIKTDDDSEIYDEVDEDMIEPLQEQLNKSLDMFKRFSKYK